MRQEQYNEVEQSGKRRLYRKYRAVLIGIAAGFLLLAAASLIYQRATLFHYGRYADKTVITMKYGKVKLRELSYYFMIEEESVNESALAYNPDNPKEYWGLYIENTFVNREAKKTALNYFLRDRIYAKRAAAKGVKLSSSEKEEISLQAKEMHEGLTEKQKTLDITEKDLKKALTENKLANNWVISLAEKKGLTMSEEVLNAYYGINSRYFKELKKRQKVHYNKQILDKISLGSLTIN